MSLKFGWCIGPVGAIIRHDTCPIRLPNPSHRKGDPPDRIWLTCGCDCHDKELGRPAGGEQA